MTNYLHIVVTFICVLFLYIHIQFQLSPSEERQIFVIEHPVHIPIEEIFELKQPIIMKLLHAHITNELTKEQVYKEGQNIDIYIYDNSRTNTHAHILSSVSASRALFDTDEEARYYTEKNTENILTLPSTSIIKKINATHNIFTPPLCSKEKTDVLFGSNNVTTIPQHSIMFRNIFTVTTGTVDVRLIHPDDIAKNNITTNSDYTDMTFFTQSGLDLWNNDSSDIIKATVYTGETISIPPYWIYSFKYRENAVIGASSFNSYLTEIATIKHTLLYWATRFTRPSNVINTSVTEPKTDNQDEIKNEKENNEDEIEENNEDEPNQVIIDKEDDVSEQQLQNNEINNHEEPRISANNPYPDVMVPLDD